LLLLLYSNGAGTASASGAGDCAIFLVALLVIISFLVQAGQKVGIIYKFSAGFRDGE
jgi:hypothetical protein